MQLGIRGTLLAGLGLRLVLLFYGVWQDSRMGVGVKYTDVDYRVITDAARHLSQGRSPYDRETYRYTPLLAGLMLPNVWLWEEAGKLLFCIFDILAALLIYKYLTEFDWLSEAEAVKCVWVWLFNPLTFAISTRGSAEPIMAFLLLLLLYLIRRGHFLLAGIVYASSIHFKIYPIIYALPILLKFQCQKKFQLQNLVIPSKNLVVFGLPAFVVLALLTWATYHYFGYVAIFETYLYHIFRKDVKHNFSIYFYMYYLNADSESLLLKIIPLFLQLSVMIILSIAFYKDLPFCFFVTTFAFVILNKVCTSQYFIWYLTYLPLIAHRVKLPPLRAITLAVLWLVGQVLWLIPAYLLEFKAFNVFELIWIASINFFLINVYILKEIISSYELPVNKKLK